MKEYKNAQGSQEEVKLIEFDKDTVYVRDNIIKVEDKDFACWQYNEIQYTYQEYIEIQNNKIKEAEIESADLLLDSAQKEVKLSILEKDIADLMLNIVGGVS